MYTLRAVSAGWWEKFTWEAPNSKQQKRTKEKKQGQKQELGPQGRCQLQHGRAGQAHGTELTLHDPNRGSVRSTPQPDPVKFSKSSLS